MPLSATLSRLAAKLRASQKGFTMIELLIVIAILGILAVAVLAAINPIEQINRGRDTGTRSDAEQLLGAIDRFNAFSGHLPWVSNPSDSFVQLWQYVDDVDWNYTTPGGEICPILTRLGTTPSTMANCTNTEELKDSFISKVSDNNYNKLYIYNRGLPGDSTYVCFVPQSNAFRTEADTRCTTGLPADLADIADRLCNTAPGLQDWQGNEIDSPVICLP